MIQNGSLLLPGADEGDAGVYICLARNNAGYAMMQVILRIHSEFSCRFNLDIWTDDCHFGIMGSCYFIITFHNMIVINVLFIKKLNKITVL